MNALNKLDRKTIDSMNVKHASLQSFKVSYFLLSTRSQKNGDKSMCARCWMPGFYRCLIYVKLCTRISNRSSGSFVIAVDNLFLAAAFNMTRH